MYITYIPSNATYAMLLIVQYAMLTIYVINVIKDIPKSMGNVMPVILHIVPIAIQLTIV
jgi:hypothetical protein